VQPVPVLQPSVVHGSPSLQFGGAPPTHVPEPLHWSPVVHAFASSHDVPEALAQVSGVSLQVCAQNASAVHGLPLCVAQLPPAHVSVPLQNNPSSHDDVLFGCVQEPEPLQMSFVQTLPSLVHAVPLDALQLSAASWHTFAHTAPPVHGSPV
jgi:hypothetical protein